jgi:hypothetical protein
MDWGVMEQTARDRCTCAAGGDEPALEEDSTDLLAVGACGRSSGVARTKGPRLPVRNMPSTPSRLVISIGQPPNVHGTN